MTHTHPLAIIVALLALGQLFGLLGMFFAVPVVVCAKEILAWWRPAAASDESERSARGRPEAGFYPARRGFESLRAHQSRLSRGAVFGLWPNRQVEPGGTCCVPMVCPR